jgi:hypothetical protein
MKKILFYILTCCSLLSCKKYLDKKPDIKLAIPKSLSDFQKIVDDPSISVGSIPQIGDLGSDDYYLTPATYQSWKAIPQNCYVWASDIWQGQSSTSDWTEPYNSIYKANIVLEGLRNYNITNSTEQATKNDIMGQALFVRAQMHYFLEETFGQPYRPATSNADLGIALKLSSNPSDKAQRQSVQTVYNQIINDLILAKDLVPPAFINGGRPSKAAILALLARVYLSMQDYSKAGAYADSSIQIKGTLLNYNDIPAGTQASTNPFSQFPVSNELKEIIYFAIPVSYAVIRSSVITTYIDTTLVNSYDPDDLRKTIFFRYTAATNTYNFKGSYTAASVSTFSGIAVDEMYLIRAESSARLNNKDSALTDLNRLLVNRWKTGKFTNVTATDAQDALDKILTERRKELIFRGLRWIDLRRLNQEPRYAKTLTRKLDSQTYTLPPNDKKYAYPIPDIEIQLSHLQQNPR